MASSKEEQLSDKKKKV